MTQPKIMDTDESNQKDLFAQKIRESLFVQKSGYKIPLRIVHPSWMPDGDWRESLEFKRRITMAMHETVKQLEYEANEVWKGKRIIGETRLGPTPYDGPIHRVAVSCYENANDGPCVTVDIYAMITFPFGTFEMYVQDPRFPDEVMK